MWFDLISGCYNPLIWSRNSWIFWNRYTIEVIHWLYSEQNSKRHVILKDVYGRYCITYEVMAECRNIRAVPSRWVPNKIVPTDWRTASIVPIFKKGYKSKASNYRPVSLTVICSKMPEHNIHSNAMDHLIHPNILSDSQHEFGARRSCKKQLVIISNNNKKHYLRGNKLTKFHTIDIY